MLCARYMIFQKLETGVTITESDSINSAHVSTEIPRLAALSTMVNFLTNKQQLMGN